MSGLWLALSLMMLPSHSGAAGPELSAFLSVVADKEPPKVVTLEPADMDMEVDAKKMLRLIVTFDRPMSDRQSASFCGGGPNFPKIKGKPYWDTPKKVALDVELEPDHVYSLSLNCGEGGSGFRSKEEVPLESVPWTFATAPEKLPDPLKQKVKNKKALTSLQSVLEEKYSYYDLRVQAWDKLYREHEPKILAARTDRSWTAAVARMLAPTQDLHLYLRLGDQTFGTGGRSVDSLFRQKLLAKYVSVQPAGKLGLLGRTTDGIGYLMIRAWENPQEMGGIEAALGGLRDCKAIVVDVRPNSGGDEILAQNVAAWFVEGTKAYAKHRTRVRAGKNGFDPVMSRVVTGNKDAARRLDVPIAVLTSRYIMSSNESFVMMLQQAKDCTLVGQPTFGSSGCPRPHELPNGVTIVVPSWQDLRLDETCVEGEGIAPNVLVECDAKMLETGDPILEKALAILREKVGAGKR